MAGNLHSFYDWSGAGADPQGGESAPVLGPTPLFRSPKDRQLSAWGTSPDVQHPDGYLGTQSTTTRRSDKLVRAVHRQNSRSYSRGVHKGERINPGDYHWASDFHPLSGIERQAQGGARQAPVGQEPVTLTNDGKAGPRGTPSTLDRPQLEVIDAERQSRLKGLLPRWR